MRLLAPLTLLLLQPVFASTIKECCESDHLDGKFHKKLAKQYASLWSGDYSLAEKILHPDVTLYADSFPFGPTGVTPVGANSRDELVNFIKSARSGWDKYEFDVRRWVGFEYQNAIRWTLDGELGPDHKSHPTKKPQGTPIVFNGTDFLTLDKCTGLIRIIDSSQDQVNEYDQLGIYFQPS